MTTAFRLSQTLLFVIALLFPFTHARASGPAITHGDELGEPLPTPASAQLVREELNIDMRPVSDKQPVQVTARYVVHNGGAPQPLTLFFPGTGRAHLTVRHQGRALPSRDDTRQVAGEGKQTGRSVELMLAPGEQVIEVTSQARPDALHLGLVDSYLVDYHLARARGWSAYGQLALRVQLPEGFELLDAPLALTESAGELRGAYASLPAGVVPHTATDAGHVDSELAPATLRLRIAPARGPYLALEAARWLGCLLAVLAPFAFALYLRRRAHKAPARPIVRLASLGACLLLVAALPLLAFPVQGLWLVHSTPPHGYLLAILAAWGVGGLLALAVHVLVGRGARNEVAG